MTFTPTPEQAAIVEAAVRTEDNLIVQALAGAAKTSTLVLLAQALPNTSMLCLAFNKRIATEMQERLPPNCTAMTLNSLGHRVWKDTLGRGLILDDDKVFKLLQTTIKSLPRHQSSEAYEYMSETLKALKQGKVAGWIPDHHYVQAKRLLSNKEFFDSLDDEPTSLQEQLLIDVTLKSIELGVKGTIDYNDQILLPTIFPSMFDHYPLVLIDEAQDLSNLNHATLAKLVRKRLIGVGDSRQAIYAFRGAHSESMSVMAERFHMRELRLSVSFRCPQSVVREARQHAPHMQWPDWAIEGSVRHLDSWAVQDIPEDAAILCRNNAPLFSLALQLLRGGRSCQITGNDVGAGLIKIMKKFGRLDMSRGDAFGYLEAWRAMKLLKTRTPDKVEDQYACMAIFLNKGNTLNEAIAYAEHLFKSQGPIQLTTIHKAKGLEWDTVYLLDRDLIRLKEGQESNLLYVAQTRAKRELVYFRSDGLDRDDMVPTPDVPTIPKTSTENEISA